MADNSNTDELVENKPTITMVTPEEELQRLRKLPTSDLINELFFARQKLRTFLEEKGIPVPELNLSTENHKTLLELAGSLYVENFTRTAINAIPEDVESVNSSVKSFVMLFDSLITTNSFEQVMVSVEGSDEPCTVKQLLEDYDNSRIDEDRKVVISVHSLRAQLSALIEDDAGSKNLEEIADSAIAATRNTQHQPSDKTYRSKLGQGAYSYSEFSPFINQEIYNALFSVKAENAENFFERRDQEEIAKQGGGDYGLSSIDGAQGGSSAFDDNAEVPEEQQDIFDDFYSDESKRNKKQNNLSAEDIDKLLGSM